jgi:hypothetical protein
MVGQNSGLGIKITFTLASSDMRQHYAPLKRALIGLAFAVGCSASEQERTERTPQVTPGEVRAPVPCGIAGGDSIVFSNLVPAPETEDVSGYQIALRPSAGVWTGSFRRAEGELGRINHELVDLRLNSTQGTIAFLMPKEKDSSSFVPYKGQAAVPMTLYRVVNGKPIRQ